MSRDVARHKLGNPTSLTPCPIHEAMVEAGMVRYKNFIVTCMDAEVNVKILV